VEVIAERAAFREACEAARASGRDVLLVPTMGALHEGHESLLTAARQPNAFVVMTLFVNPLQFGKQEDLQTYPRTPEADLEVAERAGCDLVFQPSVDEMYPRGEPEVTVDPGPLGERLEGESRPGHFRGVLTVVGKLFALTGPCRAFFGEKDAQQVELIRRMARDLDLPVEVVGCPTLRESDGLALSSRNVRLSPEERAAAPVLWRALHAGKGLVRDGEESPRVVRDILLDMIAAEPLAVLDYAAVLDRDTWEEPHRILGIVRLLVSARFGGTRLIDNVTAANPAFSARQVRPVGAEERGE
jgi:pantoate--beta-alanine ligase